MKYLVPLIVILFSLYSCSLLSNKNLPEPTLLHTGMIKNISVEQNQIYFSVTGVTPQPCYRFHSYEFEKSDHVINIRIYGRRTTNDPCPHVLSSVEDEISVPVVSGETYSFKFWRYEGATLDTTVTIP